jgi:hypothetical protein
MFPVRRVTRHKPNPRRHPAVHKCSCNFQGVRRDLRKLRMFDLISYLRQSTTVTFASSMLTTPMPHGRVAHCGRIFITLKHPPFTEIPRTLTRMFPMFEVLGMTNREGWCAACLFAERPNNGWGLKPNHTILVPLAKASVTIIREVLTVLSITRHFSGGSKR